MEIIAKISKGTKMDQVYISKARSGLDIGSYVIIKPISSESETKITKLTKPYFYGLKVIEPIKLEIMKKIFEIIEKNTQNIQNIIITGSFLEKGFKFNDIDILIISENKINEISIKSIENKIKSIIGVKPHLIAISRNSLQEGISKDPLYNLMLSKCIANARIIFKIKRKFDYKILDLHLLKSEPLIYNFDISGGEEKYYLTRNLIAIKLFIENKNLTPNSVNSEITNLFKLKNIDEIKNNILDKKFLGIYKTIYKQVQSKIFNLAKNDAK